MALYSAVEVNRRLDTDAPFYSNIPPRGVGAP